MTSRFGWSPGMESTFIDHLLMRPTTSWRGVRGVRAAFGAEASEEKLDEIAMEEAEDDFWDLSSADLDFVDLDELADFGEDDELDMHIMDEEGPALRESDLLEWEEDTFGRLYRAQDYEMVKASEGDLGALAGQSGWSGYRGGRPTFGATDAQLHVGQFRYSGNEIATFALGAGFLAVFAKSMDVI